MKAIGLHAAGLIVTLLASATLASIWTDGNQAKGQSEAPQNTSSKSSAPLKNGNQSHLTIEQKILRIQELVEKFQTSYPSFNSDDFEHAVWNLTRTMSSEDIKTVMQFLETMDAEQLPKYSRYIIHSSLLHRWATHDGASALKCAIDISNTPYRSSMWKACAGTWMHHDAAGLQRWLDINRESLKDDVALNLETQLFKKLAHEDFAMALDRANAAPNDLQKKLLPLLVAPALLDETKLTSLISTIDYLENRHSALVAALSLIEKLSAKDLKKSIEFAESWQGINKNYLIRRVAYKRIEKAPLETLSWVTDQLDPTQEASNVLTSLYLQWDRDDNLAANSWLTAQPKDRRDHLYSSKMPWLLSTGKFSQAAEISLKISDKNLMLIKQREIYQSWLNGNKAEAESWISSLPPADRKAILSKPTAKGE